MSAEYIQTSDQGTPRMKAVWYERNGPAGEVLQCGEIPDPVPGAGEVLVRVHASGVNPSDWKTRSGSRPMGAAQIIATVSSQEKAGHAKAAGAHEVINYKTEAVPDRVREITGGRGVDRV